MKEVLPKAHYQLGLNLLKNIEAKNVLVSPVSLSWPLALLAEGSTGETKRQIQKVLGFHGNHANRLMSGIGKYWKQIYDFTLADALWINPEIKIKGDFLQKARDAFGVEYFLQPFDATVIREVNTWVNNNTHGMINGLIDNNLDDSIRMLLLNACAFNSKWEKPYGPLNVKEPSFKNDDSTEVQIEMLFDNDELIYFENDICKGFTKNYQEADFEFVGILPNEDIGLSGLLQKLTGAELVRLLSESTIENTVTEIPKFKGQCSISLNPVLQKLGMVDAFDDAKADFKKIADDNLLISEAMQKTVIELDEEGTKASAATGFVMNVRGLPREIWQEPKRVILDRPFLYIIRDARNDLPLFMGVEEHL